MCCYNNPKAVEKFLKKHRNHKTITVYKRLQFRKEVNYNTISSQKVLPKVLESPHRYTEYLPGKIKTTSRQKVPSKKHTDIKLGFHCYLSKDEAEDMCDYGEFVVKMKVNVKDIIAVSAANGHAVFREAYFSRSEYKRAINR